MLELILKLTLVIFMIGNLFDMGLRLAASEITRNLKQIRFVSWTMLWGFVILPALALLLTRLFPLSPDHATGLVLLGLAPCAPFLPPMVERAKGDLGLAAVALVITSVTIVVYMPIVVPVLAAGLNASPGVIAKPLVLFLLAPLAAGLAIRQFYPRLAQTLYPIVKTMTGLDTILMLALCVIIYGRGFLSLVGSSVIGAELVFFTAATLAPAFFSVGTTRNEAVVLSLAMTTRNLGAALAPLFIISPAPRAAIITVILGVIMQAAFSFAAATVFGRYALSSQHKEV